MELLTVREGRGLDQEELQALGGIHRWARPWGAIEDRHDMHWTDDFGSDDCLVWVHQMFRMIHLDI